ncbi:unnamed protein product [Cladocopium goreaui]|uniref:Ankyrin repeat domain-containing protein 17 n=1 Tax=Cladocopium goreaui TaxID=2562237 RepID=A0A9P1D1E6_9DINO|nr:unnamed protein product [Cladocopium goreaui]
MSLHSFLGFLLLLAAACSAAELPSEGGVVGVEEQKVIFKDGMGGIPGEEEEHFTREDISCSFMLMGMFFFTMVIFYLVNYPDDDIKRYSWSIINTTISIFCVRTPAALRWTWYERNPDLFWLRETKRKVARP